MQLKDLVIEALKIFSNSYTTTILKMLMSKSEMIIPSSA
jgi:hypothetical protein